MEVHNLIVDYDNNQDIKNIEISNIDNVNPFTKKIYFYNPLVNEPLHKFWFCIKNAKILSTSKNRLDIVIASSEEKLVASLKSLDSIVIDSLKRFNIEDKISPSIITSDIYPPRMDLILDSNSIVYNHSSEVCSSLKLLKKNLKFTAFIEFDSINITKSKISKTWRVVQLKEEAPIDLTISLFAKPFPSIHQQPIFSAYPQHCQQPYYTPNPYGNSFAPPHMMQSSHLPLMSPLPLSLSLPPPPPPPPPPPSMASTLSMPYINCAPLPSKQLEQSNSKNEPSTGSGFMPPTENQLKDILGKLKKRNTRVKSTKETESKDTNIESKDQNQSIKTGMTDDDKTNTNFNLVTLKSDLQIIQPILPVSPNNLIKESLHVTSDTNSNTSELPIEIRIKNVITCNDIKKFLQEVTNSQSRRTNNTKKLMKRVKIASDIIELYLKTRYSKPQIQTDNILVNVRSNLFDMLEDDDTLDLSVIKNHN
jgi:hypothetical protein